MKIVCISDTHGDHEQVSLPSGDLLVHAGDVTAHGTESDFIRFIDWFAAQQFKYKVFVAGNHDTYLEDNPKDAFEQAASRNVLYLNDSGASINGVQVWGSPITPRFLNWSFMRDPGEDIEKHWSLIPQNTQLLITHGPVWGVLDEVQRSADFTEHTGCPSLGIKVGVVRPEYHVFGHIHEGYGQHSEQGTTYLNVSAMNKYYKVENAPVVIHID